MKDYLKRLATIFEERHITASKIIRFVYVFENQEQELFFTHKIGRKGYQEDEFFKGWQLCSEYIDASGAAFSELVDIPNVKLIDVFYDNQKKKILHFVYHFTLKDTTDFEVQSEADDDYQWLFIDEALVRASFEADKRIIPLVKNGAKNILEGYYPTKTANDM